MTRNTLDGKASLIQNFGLTVGGPGSPTTFQVQMTVNNRTSSALSNVIVRRQVDFDIDTGGAAGWAGFLSNHTRTKGSVSAFHDPAEAPSGKESHGIMMMLHQPAGTWETRITNSILDPSCNPTAAPLAANYVARGDYGDTIIFNVGTIPAGDPRRLRCGTCATEPTARRHWLARSQPVPFTTRDGLFLVLAGIDCLGGAQRGAS